MNRPLLHCLPVPLLAAAIVSLPPWIARGDDGQRAGGDCISGGGSIQCAAGTPMNGCVNCSQDRSGGFCSSQSPTLIAEEPPPPGTLGRTYQLPSRAVPADKHPRVGMIDVCCPNAEHVIVRWTNDFRTEETLKGVRDECDPSLWHFESKPLVPGLTQIYRVEVYRDGPGSAPSEVRYVRLILGRIVFLTV